MSGMTVDQELAGFMYSLEKSGGYLGGVSILDSPSLPPLREERAGSGSDFSVDPPTEMFSVDDDDSDFWSPRESLFRLTDQQKVELANLIDELDFDDSLVASADEVQREEIRHCLDDLAAGDDDALTHITGVLESLQDFGFEAEGVDASEGGFWSSDMTFGSEIDAALAAAGLSTTGENPSIAAMRESVLGSYEEFAAPEHLLAIQPPPNYDAEARRLHIFESLDNGEDVAADTPSLHALSNPGSPTGTDFPDVAAIDTPPVYPGVSAEVAAPAPEPADADEPAANEPAANGVPASETPEAGERRLAREQAERRRQQEIERIDREAAAAAAAAPPPRRSTAPPRSPPRARRETVEARAAEPDGGSNRRFKKLKFKKKKKKDKNSPGGFISSMVMGSSTSLVGAGLQVDLPGKMLTKDDAEGLDSLTTRQILDICNESRATPWSESFMERTVDGLADADGVHTVQDIKSFRPADFDRLSCKPVVREALRRYVASWKSERKRTLRLTPSEGVPKDLSLKGTLFKLSGVRKKWTSCYAQIGIVTKTKQWTLAWKKDINASKWIGSVMLQAARIDFLKWGLRERDNAFRITPRFGANVGRSYVFSCQTTTQTSEWLAFLKLLDLDLSIVSDWSESQAA